MPSEQQLIVVDEVARAKDGDADAFRSLLREHMPAVLRFARSLVSSESDAEDVAQESFLSAYRNLNSFREDSSFLTWVLVIARNNAYRKTQKNQKEKVMRASYQELSIAAGWGADTPEALLSRADDIVSVRKAISGLPPLYQSVLVLREIEQLSGEETAQILEVSISAMKARLHRARLLLAKELRKEAP